MRTHDIVYAHARAIDVVFVAAGAVAFETHRLIRERGSLQVLPGQHDPAGRARAVIRRWEADFSAGRACGGRDSSADLGRRSAAGSDAAFPPPSALRAHLLRRSLLAHMYHVPSGWYLNLPTSLAFSDNPPAPFCRSESGPGRSGLRTGRCSFFVGWPTAVRSDGIVMLGAGLCWCCDAV